MLLIIVTPTHTFEKEAGGVGVTHSGQKLKTSADFCSSMLSPNSRSSSFTTGWSGSPPPWYLARIRAASCSRPTAASHRGDSGMNQVPSMMKSGGRSCRASGSRKASSPSAFAEA